jgi:hypothetical protein
MPTMRTGMSNCADPRVGASTLTAVAAVREIVTGTIVPRRSACLPATRDSTASIADAARNVPAMSSAEAPSWARRSGARTFNTPNAIPASNVNHRPVLTRRSFDARSASRNPCGSDSRGVGTRKATPMSAAPATAAMANTGPVPTS